MCVWRKSGANQGFRRTSEDTANRNKKCKNNQEEQVGGRGEVRSVRRYAKDRGSCYY